MSVGNLNNTITRREAAALANEEFANKDSELLACDVECRLAGVEGFYLELDIAGLDELVWPKAS